MLILCTDRYYFSLDINEKEAFSCEYKNLFCECLNKIGVHIIAQNKQTLGEGGPSRKEGACMDILEMLGSLERVVGIMDINRWSTIFELNLVAILI